MATVLYEIIYQYEQEENKWANINKKYIEFLLRDIRNVEWENLENL